MFKLLGAELKYNFSLFVMIIFVPILGCVWALFDINCLINSKRSEIIFLSFLIYFTVYLVLIAIWFNLLKEGRNRMLIILPVIPPKISLAHILLLIIPLLLISIFYWIMHNYVIKEWFAFVDRVLNSMGMTLIFGSSVILIRNVLFSFPNEKLRYKELIITAIVLLIILLSILLDQLLYGILHSAVYYLWGFILSITAYYSFLVRKSFLN